MLTSTSRTRPAGSGTSGGLAGRAGFWGNGFGVEVGVGESAGEGGRRGTSWMMEAWAAGGLENGDRSCSLGLEAGEPP